MSEINNKYKVSKTSSNDDYSEVLTYTEVCKFMLSGGFMTMLKRMAIGEELIYNEKSLKFIRTK